MTDLIVNALGWVGSFLLVAAYWLNSKNKIDAQTSVYQSLNIIGSLLLMINTVYYGAYPSSAVNVIWLLMGTYHLNRIIYSKQKEV